MKIHEINFLVKIICIILFILCNAVPFIVTTVFGGWISGLGIFCIDFLAFVILIITYVTYSLVADEPEILGLISISSALAITVYVFTVDTQLRYADYIYFDSYESEFNELYTKVIKYNSIKRISYTEFEYNVSTESNIDLNLPGLNDRNSIKEKMKNLNINWIEIDSNSVFFSTGGSMDCANGYMYCRNGLPPKKPKNCYIYSNKISEKWYYFQRCY